MNYQHTLKGTFKSRPNRFIAHVTISGKDGKEEAVVCHVKNTGRCLELLIPGAAVILQFHPDAALTGRKTCYSLIGVWKERKEGPILINMDSQAPNQVVFEWLSTHFQPFPNSFLSNIKREVTYLQSRFDFSFFHNFPEISDGTGSRNGKQKVTPAFMEVKGVTLEENGIALFPDAPTERGIKHITELISARKNGYEAYLLFVIQMNGIRHFLPNEKTHPEFALALQAARKAGVHLLAYNCMVTENSLSIDRPATVFLNKGERKNSR